MARAKCTDDLKVHVPPTLKEQLTQLAKREDRSLGDYARYVLTRHVTVQVALNRLEGAGGDG